jgi:hypothetical protein
MIHEIFHEMKRYMYSRGIPLENLDWGEGLNQMAVKKQDFSSFRASPGSDSPANSALHPWSS